MTTAYFAAQVGYRVKREDKLTKPELGHLKKHGAPAMRHLREFKVLLTARSNLCCCFVHPHASAVHVDIAALGRMHLLRSFYSAPRSASQCREQRGSCIRVAMVAMARPLRASLSCFDGLLVLCFAPAAADYGRRRVPAGAATEARGDVQGGRPRGHRWQQHWQGLPGCVFISPLIAGIGNSCGKPLPARFFA